MQLQKDGRFHLTFSKVGGAGVARARNNQAQEFLKTDCQIFACVDADIEFTPDEFARMVEHVLAGVMNAGGPYPLKQPELAWCIDPLPGESPDPKTGLQKVKSCGTGFKFIHRSEFERQIEAHPEISYIEDMQGERGVVRWDFFSMGVVGKNSPQSRLAEIADLCAGPLDAAELRARIREVITKRHPPGRYLSEDWYFDHRHRALGGEVFVDMSFYVKHEGLIQFPIKSPIEDQPRWPADYLAAGIAPNHCADVLDGCYDVPYNPEKPPVILDIGANIGAFASWASARWPSCKLHCYEPDPKNFALLEKTACAIRTDSKSDIECRNVAMLDRNGVMPLYRGLHNCGEHSLFDIGEQSSGSVDVRVIDARYLPPTADILKLDTEGAEWPILVALNNSGKLAHVSAIMLEYHSVGDRERIEDLIEAAGFRLHAHKARCADRGELKFLKAG
jgi:FkbM family methyltransferase